jgi:NTP pyrophosphatase (non-canonical NTP hydrolase)
LHLNDYQAASRKYAVYPKETAMSYCIANLAGEAGEAAGKYAKSLRDTWHPAQLRDELRKELGDVLWMVAAVCEEVGLKMGDVAVSNLEKLEARRMAKTLQGSGDNR